MAVRHLSKVIHWCLETQHKYLQVSYVSLFGLIYCFIVLVGLHITLTSSFFFR